MGCGFRFALGPLLVSGLSRGGGGGISLAGFSVGELEGAGDGGDSSECETRVAGMYGGGSPPAGGASENE